MAGGVRWGVEGGGGVRWGWGVMEEERVNTVEEREQPGRGFS